TEGPSRLFGFTTFASGARPRTSELPEDGAGRLLRSRTKLLVGVASHVDPRPEPDPQKEWFHHVQSRGEQSSGFAIVAHLAEQPASGLRGHPLRGQDRKSTRLNSSH